MGAMEPSGAGTSVIILDPGLKQSKFMRILGPAGRPVRTVGRYLRQVDSAKVAFWADNPAPTGTIDLLIPWQPAGWKSLKAVAGGGNLSRRIDQSGEQIKMDDWPSSPLTGMPPTQASLARRVCLLLNAFKNKTLAASLPRTGFPCRAEKQQAGES